MYDVHNDGNWYNFGFLLGMGVFFGATERRLCIETLAALNI